MKNPTREEIGRRLERVLAGPSNTVQMSVADYQEIHRFARRALDMREGLGNVNRKLAKDEMPSLEDMDTLVMALQMIAEQFDEGDDG